MKSADDNTSQLLAGGGNCYAIAYVKISGTFYKENKSFREIVTLLHMSRYRARYYLSFRYYPLNSEGLF